MFSEPTIWVGHSEFEYKFSNFKYWFNEEYTILNQTRRGKNENVLHTKYANELIHLVLTLKQECFIRLGQISGELASVVPELFGWIGKWRLDVLVVEIENNLKRLGILFGRV